ncbi:GroES-like protein [Lipomyces kononenkoae]|uniref:GroES-like protein n=1 Tax=Lipomyces kononenkoae TaxID=34357 RepID=A0ACC3T2F8_LIPKO
MSLSQSANYVEKILGHSGDSSLEQDISNPSKDPMYADSTGERMKALVWMGKNNVAVTECLKPRIIESRDIIIRVTGSTVCGSDLHLLHGSVMQLEKGDILGHEFCGIIEQVAPGAQGKGLKEGDRVVASFQIACGTCLYCGEGLTSQCQRTSENRTQAAMYGGRTAGLFGYSHLTGGFAGGQAEYVRVPYGDVNLLKLPDSVPDEKGLYLSDVLATSWHAVIDTGVKKDDAVAIWGAGPVGQMAADFCFHVGASRVIVIDSGWRLDYLKSKYPKIETVDYKCLPWGESVRSRLQQLVNLGPDICIECAAGEYAKGWAHYFEMLLGMETDTSEIVNEMITSCKSFGRCGITGVYVGFTNHFNIGALMERGIRLIGNGQAPVQKYWHMLLEMVENNEIDPLKMVSHRVSLDQLDKVYHKFDKKEDGMQKVFVQTKFSSPPTLGSPPLTIFDDEGS